MIPDFQSLMLPLLKAIDDKREYSTTEILDILSSKFQLSEEELNQDLPSGVQKTFYNRVFWAKAYLKMNGLVENVRRGFFKITPLGAEILRQPPEKITVKFLKQINQNSDLNLIEEPISETEQSDNISECTDVDSIQSTPEELIEQNYQKIRENLASDLLLKIKSCSPKFFENLVVELLVKMGYGGSVQEAGSSVGRTGDGGIDGIIKEDKLGLDTIYIQAKRWENVVGRPEIQKFVGALAGLGAKKGVFITTSKFTKDAVEYRAGDTKIVLINGKMLANLMIDFDLAVSQVNSYKIKRIDNDYFEDLN